MYYKKIRIFPLVFFCFFLLSTNLFAKVELKEGPTNIPGGDAVAAGDITLMNDKIAVSIAVSTSPPWGVAKGGIIDAAAIKGGKIDTDRLTLLDFLPHKWSEWASVDADIKVLSATDKEAVVEVKRNWRTAEILSTYTIKDGDDKIYLKTVMTNTGKEELKESDPENDPNLFTGYGLWAKAGALKEPAGAEGVHATRKALAEVKTPGTKHTVAYEKDWALALYAPFATHSAYEGKDMYFKHTIAPGASMTFEGWFEILPSGDISPAYVSEANSTGQKLGVIKGTVASDSKEVLETPAIVAERNGSIYTWALGHNGVYSMTLPVGEYELYAAALNHAPSVKQKIVITEKDNQDVNFSGLAAPGLVTFKVSDQKGMPLNARLAIVKGVEQPIVFLGASTVFTKISPVGEAVASLAPGPYEFSATHGEDFLAKAKKVEISVDPGKKVEVPVTIEITANPLAQKWYNADLHHHSNLLDADTPPEFLVRSQVAAGVDYTFISDHDTVGSHKEIAKFSKEAGIKFIAGLEVSPSWAHFNIYPLPLGQGLGIDPSAATVTEIFTAARKAGAKVIAVNHPTIEYGYFTARDRGTIPGGTFNKDFNLLEINGLEKFEKDIPLFWEFWNKGERYYLTGGTDNHNVWKDKSGYMRVFVKDDASVSSVDSFIDNLLAGHSFVSQGPLIYPEILFGEDIKADTKTLNFKVEAVNGLKSVTLIGNGQELETRQLKEGLTTADVSFALKDVKTGNWYSVIVTDLNDSKAWGNPNWVVD